MLTEAFLSRLSTLALMMRGRAAGGAGGLRKSRNLGSSAEFSDYREYIPGDDIRRLDWNAAARSGRLFLKLFTEEAESMVSLVLDTSASMDAKWETAVKAAEAVGYLALCGGDRLKVYAPEGNGVRMSSVMTGRQAYPVLQRFLNSCSPAGTASVTKTVRRMEGLRKGLCLLITDGYEEEGLAGALDLLRYHQQECALIQVLSAFELHPDLEGTVRLVDSESGGAMDLNADRAALQAYRQALDDFLTETRRVCHSRQAPCVLLTEDQPFEEVFIPLLAESGMI